MPRKTVNLLLSAGLDANLAEQARQGLALDDHYAQIAIIGKALEVVLRRLELERPAYEVLSSSETLFMLHPVSMAV
ncbi:MAG: hypothetical protein J0M33_29960 [Anaerolineae bacterium]|nr:hypothetical protein [Anaerolineae bacterium]